MKRLIFLFISLFYLSSCIDDGKDTGVWPTPYMITNYVLTEEIVCSSSTIYNNSMSLNYYGEDLLASLRATYDRFSYFNKLYNDDSFNGSTYPGAFSALAYPFDKITLSCDSDYNAKHPAGTPLDDIVKLEFESYWDFIQNDYQYPEWYTEKECGYGEVPLKYYLSEINSDNTKLAARKAHRLVFTELPTVLGGYNFTLELTTNGKTLTTTFTHVFDDQKKIY